MSRFPLDLSVLCRGSFNMGERESLFERSISIPHINQNGIVENLRANRAPPLRSILRCGYAIKRAASSSAAGWSAMASHPLIHTRQFFRNGSKKNLRVARILHPMSGDNLNRVIGRETRALRRGREHCDSLEFDKGGEIFICSYIQPFLTLRYLSLFE